MEGPRKKTTKTSSHSSVTSDQWKLDAYYKTSSDNSLNLEYSVFKKSCVMSGNWIFPAKQATRHKGRQQISWQKVSCVTTEQMFESFFKLSEFTG